MAFQPGEYTWREQNRRTWSSRQPVNRQSRSTILRWRSSSICCLNNKKIREVIDTITSKLVLILGRFTPERKAILDALRDTLRERNYLPVVFDFDKPASRDLTETVQHPGPSGPLHHRRHHRPEEHPAGVAGHRPGLGRAGPAHHRASAAAVGHVRGLSQEVPLGAGSA